MQDPGYGGSTGTAALSTARTADMALSAIGDPALTFEQTIDAPHSVAAALHTDAAAAAADLVAFHTQRRLGLDHFHWRVAGVAYVGRDAGASRRMGAGLRRWR